MTANCNALNHEFGGRLVFTPFKTQGPASLNDFATKAIGRTQLEEYWCVLLTK